MEHEAGLNRRDFLLRAGSVALASQLIGCNFASPQAASGAADEVFIIADLKDPVVAAPPPQWAIGELSSALAARGVTRHVYSQLDHARRGIRIIVGSLASGEAESLAIRVNRNGDQTIVNALGRDEHGLVYALTELADVVRYSPDSREALRSVKDISEQPHNRIRGVMRMFVSDVEDKSWFNDKSFWQRYLTMLVTERFNRFDLALGLGYDNFRNLRDTYFFFAYPFLVSVPGYDVKAVGLSDAERDNNLAMLKFISEQSALRGLPFFLGVWTHAYEWVNSPHANYVISGLDKDHHAAYCRDALQKVLEACPAISGITLRIHGESGVTEGSYDFWKTVMDGVVRAGRPLEINLHAKGIDQQMIDIAVATGLPISVSPKFWAEHMGLPYHQARIRDAEMPPDHTVKGQFALSTGSRSFLRYGYGDLLKADRKYRIIHRIWPGTQRVLLWADPKFAAEYAKCFRFCGSDGMQMFDPLGFKGRQGSGLIGDRGGYADATLRPTGGDWEKYLLQYRLWGRLNFNPDCDPEVWNRQQRAELGESAEPLMSALSQASRILPLVTTAHDPAAANFAYWPEMYTNMSIVNEEHAGLFGKAPVPRVFGNVSPLDPQLFATCNEYCDSLVDCHPLAKTSPIEVANQLEKWADHVLADLQRVGNQTAPAGRRAAVDCEIAAGLGKFFAAKFRAAMLFRLAERSALEPAWTEALASYRRALSAWTKLSQAAQKVYVSDITFGPARQLRGHWMDRLQAIEEDIQAMRHYQRPNGFSNVDILNARNLITILKSQSKSERPELEHTPAVSFQPVEPISIRLKIQSPVQGVQLWYRHVDQAERWITLDMSRRGSSFEVSISLPAQYTNSPYAIQYYFAVTDDTEAVHLYPGFGEDFCGQPYFVMMQ